jgi:hypothetical protein
MGSIMPLLNQEKKLFFTGRTFFESVKQSSNFKVQTILFVLFLFILEKHNIMKENKINFFIFIYLFFKDYLIELTRLFDFSFISRI